ncbi:hypothetical protein CY35_05G056900 [Sphagnum magellanicum]|nr:hypothetical protein CY35_05G056900 [Sphagnum magellanicum]KAH9562127.1 hypothetical protein CY35_05G056900 [Sphagnum magellanicum]KAH9562128.1 hypothetical protein CY35_05G056900 [Sphagnum magellanicum]
MATAVKTSEIEKAEVKEESVSHLLQGDHVASKGLQLSTSWSYTQVPRQQQQGASSEDNKEDKRRQETQLQGWQLQSLQQNGKNKSQAPGMIQNAALETLSYRNEAQRGGQPSVLASPEMPFVVLIPDTQPQPQVAIQSKGVASPLPVHFRVVNASSGLENGATMDSQQPQMQHSTQDVTFQNGTLPRQAQVGAHRATAQLTIFYAGMVHVYDDIPLNKAQAIMLLAGSGNARSSNRINLPGRGATAQLFSAPNPQLGPSTSVPPVAQAATAAMTDLSWPVLPKLAANVIPRSPIAKTVDVVKELPQARQASLARFLENRKDRVRMKAAPYRIMKEGSSTPPCNKSPGPPCSRPQTWSSSPALMVGISHQNAQATQLKRDPSCTPSGSEPNSPTRAPPTPPQQSIAGDNIAGSSSGSRDLERKPNSTECQSESLLHKASQESGEAMVVDAS